MTILARVLLCTAPVALAGIATAADPPAPGAPQTIKILSADVIEEGAAGDRQSTFTLVQSEQGTCYAIAPPGGAGMAAGESYVVVAASDIDAALMQRLATDHPGCKPVDVVARAMKR